MLQKIGLMFVPLPALLLAFAACAPAPDGDSRGTTKGTTSPVGNVWRWTALTGSESLEVAQPGRYTLELMDDGRYGARADCNSGGGTYTLEGNSLTLGPGPMTLAACGPDSLDTRFAVLLGKVSGFKVDGQRLVLGLGGDAGSMVFEAMQRISLAGTSWLLRGYNNGKGGVVSVAAGATLHVAFTEDGIVRGSAGCNNFTGSYESDGQAITNGPTAVTRKMCMGEGVMEQESAFLAALSSIAAWEIRGERLQLRRADGALALDLVSAVTGTVAYRVRKALHPDAEIRVTLQDVSRADLPATVIGEQVIPAVGKQVPIPFEITFDPAGIDPRFSYAVRATITLEGKLIFTSTQAYPVITRDAPLYDVEIQLDPAGGAASSSGRR